MFPAYSKQSDNTALGVENDDWLVNSSFQLENSTLEKSTPVSVSTESASKANPSLISLPDSNKHTSIDLTADSPSNSSSDSGDSSPELIHLSGDSDTDSKNCKYTSVSKKTRDVVEVNRKTTSHQKYSSSSERESSKERRDARKRAKKNSSSSSSNSRERSRKKSIKHRKKHKRRSKSSETDKSTRKFRSRHRSNSDSSSSDSDNNRKSSGHRSRRSSLSDSDRSSSSSRGRDGNSKTQQPYRNNRKRSRRRSTEKRSYRKSNTESRNLGDTAGKDSYLKDKVPSELFYEDRNRDVNNLIVSTLSQPAVPIYHRRYRQRDHTKWIKKMRKQNSKSRYFAQLSNPVKRARILGEGPVAAESLEEERSSKTAFFNRSLAEDPSNVQMWLDYIDFQDVMHNKRRRDRDDSPPDEPEFSKSFKINNSMVQKKLAIVEKALESNPDSDELIKRRCRYAGLVLPDEKYREELRNWANKNPSSIFLWRSVLFTTQRSLSACRTPEVCKLCASAMEELHALRRSRRASPAEVTEIELKILTLLLDLGLFLRQAGLSELLWSLLSVYLELNLARLDKDKFQISSYVPEKDLRELEDAVLASEMPMPTLWMRVETLRAGVHWLSLGVEDDCEDPQRMVLPEDIAELVQPIRTPSLQMRLVLIVLSLLKVPLLPWRDTTHRSVGLADVSWGLDGPEQLLASVFRSSTYEARRSATTLVDSIQLASGAQYLATRPGQDQYIDFICSVFLSCADCLPVPEQTMICVWWLRFCRFLLQLDSWKLCTLPKGRAKKMRSAAKDLLKKEQNRNNVSLFCEFALLEREIGGLEPACKVLRGAISALPTHTPLPGLTNKGPVCALYRTLVEFLITSNEREKAKGVLVSVGTNTLLKEETPSSAAIEKAVSKFNHVSTELFVELESLEEPNEADGMVDRFHLVFDFFVEWLTCQAWLLFLTDSVWKAVSLIEDAISNISSGPKILACRREALYEVYANILGLHCRDTCGSYGLLRDAILRGLKEFPTNMTLLGIICDIETNELGSGLPQWQLSRTLCDIKSPSAQALLVFLVRFRIQNREGSSGLLSMMSLLRRLTRSINPRCPLLWRLSLQLVSAVGNDQTLKNNWYLSLEACPWVKALYLDGVQAMPGELGRIQDLLQEKELRLHVTPEELDILRAD